MKTLARLVARISTLLFAATLLAAPLPALAQQKQDTMDKKETKKKPAKKKTTKKAAKKAGDSKSAPAPGPK